MRHLKTSIFLFVAFCLCCIVACSTNVPIKEQVAGDTPAPTAVPTPEPTATPIPDLLPSLCGNWVRQDDDFEGLCLRIESCPDGYRAVIIYSPLYAKYWLFDVGMVKWEKMEQVPGSAMEFTLEDRVHSTEDHETIQQIEYYTGNGVYDLSNDLIKIKYETEGSTLTYKRVPENYLNTLEPTPVPVADDGYNIKVSGAEDFFLETSTEYEEKLSHFDFNGIKEMADAYLLEHPNANDADRINVVAPLVEEAIELLQKCTITYDKVDNKTLINYKGIDGFSNSVHLYSWIDNTWCSTEAGFIARDWLFFNEITISGEGFSKTAFYGSSSVGKEIIKGKVKESVSMSWSEEELAAIKDAKDVTIRFRNRDTKKYLDFKLSEKEIESLYTMNRLRSIYRILSDTRSYWETNKPWKE